MPESDPANSSPKCPACEYPASQAICSECGLCLDESQDRELLRHTDTKTLNTLASRAKALSISGIVFISVWLMTTAAMIFKMSFFFGSQSGVTQEAVLAVCAFVPVVAMLVCLWLVMSCFQSHWRFAVAIFRVSTIAVLLSLGTALVDATVGWMPNLQKNCLTIFLCGLAVAIWASSRVCIDLWKRTRDGRYNQNSRYFPSRWLDRIYPLLALLIITHAISGITPKGLVPCFVDVILGLGNVFCLYMLIQIPLDLFTLSKSINEEVSLQTLSAASNSSLSP